MIKNRYIKRRVADADSRACFVCYRPTSVVLVNETPNTDFFYACEAHLSDPGFATPDKEAVAELAKRQKEIEALKSEWEEIQSKKKSTEKTVESDSQKKKSSPQSEQEQQYQPPNATSTKPVKVVYELNKGVYNLRIGAKKRISQEKKVKTLLETPGIFPEVPKHKPT